MELFISFVGLAAIAALVYVNIWNYERRKQMTANQREAEDREDRYESTIW